MVARVYDQSVDCVILSEARLVALKLVNCCRPRENWGALTYTARLDGTAELADINSAVAMPVLVAILQARTIQRK